ncbi:MAG TPA: YigZ family protein [Candidatus Marinimicrobia bacterium]|nr:YigZ family protein [Candidatus Neomarinimicrobiota bacterium]
MKFQTVSKAGYAKYSIKGSRFFAEAHPIQSPDEAEAIINNVKKKYHDATHHCYGWRFGQGKNEAFRYSDDGEPSGTAGKPIFDITSKHRLSNVLLIVTRYFGGTKLGTGGLVRAYSSAAELSLEGIEILTVELGQMLEFKCTYEQHPVIMREINRFPIIHIWQEFLENVSIRAEVDESYTDLLTEAVFSATAGSVTGKLVDRE